MRPVRKPVARKATPNRKVVAKKPVAKKPVQKFSGGGTKGKKSNPTTGMSKVGSKMVSSGAISKSTAMRSQGQSMKTQGAAMKAKGSAMKSKGMAMKAKGTINGVQQKKSKEVAAMSPAEVRLESYRLKQGANGVGFGPTLPKESRSFKDKEVLRRDMDLYRKNTDESSTVQNSKGTVTTVNKKGMPSGYKTQTKVVKNDGTTYYKEKKAPYKYKSGGMKKKAKC